MNVSAIINEDGVKISFNKVLDGECTDNDFLLLEQVFRQATELQNKKNRFRIHLSDSQIIGAGILMLMFSLSIGSSALLLNALNAFNNQSHPTEIR
jgi:hypothetical protein